MNFTPKNLAFADMIRGKLQGQHFMNFIGFELTKIEAGLVEGQMPIIESIKQQTGFVHGGATATFADLVMGFAAYSLVDVDQVVFTADLRISYLNPGIGQQVWAKGWVIKPGQNLIFCEAEIWTKSWESGVGNLESHNPLSPALANQILIAKASSTMAVVNLSGLGTRFTSDQD